MTNPRMYHSVIGIKCLAASTQLATSCRFTALGLFFARRHLLALFIAAARSGVRRWVLLLAPAINIPATTFACL